MPPSSMGLHNATSLRSKADVWLFHMFWPSVWCAAVAIVGACLLCWVRGHTRPESPDAAEKLPASAEGVRHLNPADSHLWSVSKTRALTLATTL